MNPLIFYSAEPALAFPVAIGLFLILVVILVLMVDMKHDFIYKKNERMNCQF